MNTTATNILKLLSQSKMSAEDILHYVDVEKSAIRKGIKQINEFLKDLNLNTIKKEEDEYVLNLKRKELEYLYSKMEFLSSDEKIDYLYLKFLYKGFLNLEKEKEILNISRSTIIRCFKGVKELLDRNGSNYDYICGKGLKLNIIGEKEKGCFCKKLMKYCIENNYLSSPLKELLDEIREVEVEDRINKINSILERLDIMWTYPFIAFLVSLEPCIKVFKGFEKYKKNIELEKTSIDILNVVSEIGDDFSVEYKNQITQCLKNYVFKESLEIELKKVTSLIIKKLKIYLNIDILEKSFEEVLFFKVYISLFKYENKILKINRANFSAENKKVLNILNFILKEFNVDIYYYDKYLIVNIIRDLIITQKILDIKKILIVFNELALVEKSFFQNGLKKVLPHIKFDLQTSIVYRNKTEFYKNNYDYILSDEAHDKDIIRIDVYDKLLISQMLEKKAFEKAIKDFK